MSKLSCALLTLLAAVAPARANIQVSPPAVALDNPEASQQLRDRAEEFLKAARR